MENRISIPTFRFGLLTHAATLEVDYLVREAPPLTRSICHPRIDFLGKNITCIIIPDELSCGLLYYRVLGLGMQRVLLIF